MRNSINQRPLAFQSWLCRRDIIDNLKHIKFKGSGVHVLFISLVITLFLPQAQVLAGDKKDTYIYLGLSQPSLDLKLNDQGSVDRNTSFHELDYRPKVPTIALIGMSYGGITASVSEDLGDSDETYVDYTDYSLALFYSWFGFDASYTEFIRFRINQSQGFDDALKDDELDKKDLAMRFYSADIYLLPIRWNFDFDAAFDPSKEKTNGLGLGLIGSWNRTSVETKLGLIPAPWKTAFGSDGAIKEGELTGISLQAAVCGTLKLGPLYFSALLGAGPGQHSFTYSTSNEERSGNGEQVILRQRLAFGLTGAHMFTALLFNSDSPDYMLKYMTIAPTHTEIGVVAGYKW